MPVASYRMNKTVTTLCPDVPYNGLLILIPFLLEFVGCHEKMMECM